jgi:DNA-binding CsgD family transcriptional regulator
MDRRATFDFEPRAIPAADTATIEAMAVPSPEQLREDIVRLAHRGASVREFSFGAARILARAVPFEGVCVLTMDPATLVPTGEFVRNGLPPAEFARMAEIEHHGEDFNAFSVLALGGRRAASLSAATDGELDRSRRHREVREPNGFGDELRAVLADDSRVWGALTLLRGSDAVHFAPTDSAMVASLSSALAEGLRRAMLLDAGPPADQPDGAGVAVLAPDNSVTVADAAAERWLSELNDDGSPLPSVVTAVATRARAIVARRAEDATVARARVRAPSGRWLVVRASTLGDHADAQLAVLFEPVQARELAPLIADAVGLSERERAVTELVAHGFTTNAIAGRLYISPWTVQDHLKAIFEKVGVSTRGELIARLFFDHDAARLTD